jgi:hypothetical protein
MMLGRGNTRSQRTRMYTVCMCTRTCRDRWPPAKLTHWDRNAKTSVSRIATEWNESSANQSNCKHVRTCTAYFNITLNQFLSTTEAESQGAHSVRSPSLIRHKGPSLLPGPIYSLVTTSKDWTRAKDSVHSLTKPAHPTSTLSFFSITILRGLFLRFLTFQWNVLLKFPLSPRSSETSVTIPRNTWRHIAKYSKLYVTALTLLESIN